MTKSRIRKIVGSPSPHERMMFELDGYSRKVIRSIREPRVGVATTTDLELCEEFIQWLTNHDLKPPPTLVKIVERTRKRRMSPNAT